MAASESRRRRCAIYTRKSSEEGLEQDFNSLDAQREACEAYIRSQKSEGWILVSTRYDDGGFSGGNIERPALTRLLEDIDAGKIDTVVVYKVDRLTRSLSDFAKIVDVLDGHSVSFVSITQQFNTTTSMGRLTLNMLLSFAQFEREVTGERIRDKIAASKRKGLWMGGLVPLGYAANGRTLEVVESEAKTVRILFKLYLELGSVRRLKEEAVRRGLRSKLREGKDERVRGNRSFSRGALYHLLSNPVYIGRIPHREDSYEGQHPAILDRKTWDAVQKQLNEQAPSPSKSTEPSRRSPLCGKLFDEEDRPITPVHTVKSGRRYRYYVSRISPNGGDKRRSNGGGWRLPARELEQVVATAVRSILKSPSELARSARAAHVESERITDLMRRLKQPHESPLDLVRSASLKSDRLSLRIDLASLLDGPNAVIEHSVPMTLRRRGVETRMVVPGDSSGTGGRLPDHSLVKAISRAHRWFEDLASGRVPSLDAIAKTENISSQYVGSVLPLSFLSPGLVRKILAADHPPEFSTEVLIKQTDLPLRWDDQVRILGF